MAVGIGLATIGLVLKIADFVEIRLANPSATVALQRMTEVSTCFFVLVGSVFVPVMYLVALRGLLREMIAVTLEEAQSRLLELIELLPEAEELIVTHNNRPVARILAAKRSQGTQRKPGNCKGMVTIVSDDDEHLSDLSEYMA